MVTVFPSMPQGWGAGFLGCRNSGAEFPPILPYHVATELKGFQRVRGSFSTSRLLSRHDLNPADLRAVWFNGSFMIQTDLGISQDRGRKTEHHQMPEAGISAPSVGVCSGPGPRQRAFPPSETRAFSPATAGLVGTSQRRNLIWLWDFHHAVLHFSTQGTLHSVKGESKEFSHLQIYPDGS